VNRNMTHSTNRYNIELMSLCITWMVILLGGLRAIVAESGIRTWQFASGNSMMYSIFSFSSFRMSNAITFICFFTCLALIFTFLTSFALFSFSIFSYNQCRAKLAVILKSSLFVFMKIRNCFDLLAFRATFCLNCFSHNQLHNSWLRLGPYNPTAGLCGLLNYRRIQ